jgi:hypothetical protein
MIADPAFIRAPKSFWALVRTLSQHLGYTERKAGGDGPIAVHTVRQQAQALLELGLNPDVVTDTPLGAMLEDYFRYRALMLNEYVKPRLMDADEARDLFNLYAKRLKPRCPIPMNKQKGDKRSPAYLTGLVNMLVEQAIGQAPCNYDPRELTTFTDNGRPVRTLARRVDGAFPSPVNPKAIWEIKEYYYTTTFGSRVADGVYETLLDGLELEEMRESVGIAVEHYLFVDSYFTWWKCGRSYLCRLVDMLNMGYCTEVVFGKEVAERLPSIASRWVAG